MTKESEARTIAVTILDQLGGNRFIAMTGAKSFAFTGKGLRFRLPGNNFARHGINEVEIILKNDTYNMIFSRRFGLKNIGVQTVCGLYADQLQGIFTSVTGLATHL